MVNKVLLIDSKPDPKRKVTSALNKANFVVVDVSDSSEALMKLAEFKPNMVILDEEVSDAMQLCSQIATGGTPVILVGEDKSQGIWKKALVEAGADFYMRKPISREELVARINAILRRYESKDNRREMPVLNSN